MYIKSLELANFRNYKKANIELNPGLNIFVGENAQGKTNLAEAIYYLGNLRSYRASKDKELIYWGENRAYIKAKAQKKTGESLIEYVISSENKKALRINGVNISKISEALGCVYTVIFSPEDLRLVKEGPAQRRRFIDIELNQIKPRYHHALVQYTRVLTERNNILKSIGRSPSLKTMAEVYGEQMAEYGSFIIKERQEFIKKLALISKLMHRKITEGKEELDIAYKSSVGEESDRESIKKILLNYYTNCIDQDIMRGYTQKGPHRDDLSIKINGIDVRTYGSQGQQRTAALSLKLSEIEIIKSESGEYPILLLDDVLSELDLSRQKYLLESLKQLQTVLTCTNLNEIGQVYFDNKSVFNVRCGQINKTE